MLKEVFISRTNCITPLGFDVESNFNALKNSVSGIKQHNRVDLLNQDFFASIIDDSNLNDAFEEISASKHSRLEKMMLLALHPVIEAETAASARTGFILSTTKGNITALDKTAESVDDAQLGKLAKTISNFFDIKTEPIVLSNACVSGIMAVSVAKRLIQSGMYDDVYVVAGDEVSEFVLSGFNSFQAMSHEPCKPYSKNRKGVTLGEAAAAVLVTSSKENASIHILGDGSINDANHISGPSRTGEGLFLSIESALKESGINASEIDYISAHGTATPFNDEMEAIAFNRWSLQQVPLNSLKGYYGHTLGASGLLETVIGIASVKDQKLVPSLGFDQPGTSQSLNIITESTGKQINYFLKTASGFGGCNTAVLFGKVN
ncbi:MAG TPA: beta-ketoacyl synthase N-terminal-like domain-containing protein [Flavobacterium sp.]|jgi:3-oxoacyl-[acyl-carrier-protein] synthase-1